MIILRRLEENQKTEISKSPRVVEQFTTGTLFVPFGQGEKGKFVQNAAGGWKRNQNRKKSFM
jgi:hypothetical protein